VRPHPLVFASRHTITFDPAVSTEKTGVKQDMLEPPSAWQSSASRTASLHGQSVPQAVSDGAHADCRQDQTALPASNVAAFTGAAVHGAAAASTSSSPPESVVDPSGVVVVVAGLLEELQPISTRPPPTSEATANPTK
jgi:hypothetical protein